MILEAANLCMFFSSSLYFFLAPQLYNLNIEIKMKETTTSNNGQKYAQYKYTSSFIIIQQLGIFLEYNKDEVSKIFYQSPH